MPKSKQELLADLEISTRQNPPPETQQLAQSCRGLVFGEGNPDASLVFIGEAPGEQEDKLGRPFVGRSGKLLDKLLEGIGLHRPDVYITNIVKFRPPKNRDPLPIEKEAFLPILLQQLDIIDPKVIATLGRHSTQSLLGTKTKVHQIRGKPQRDAKGRVVLPIYHPAAALYNPANLDDLESQFLILSAIIQGTYKLPSHQSSLL